MVVRAHARRAFARFAVAGLAWIGSFGALAIGPAGCGVMASTDDCASKATCIADASTAPAEAGANGSDSDLEGGDEGDLGLDGEGGETSGDAAGGDATIEASSDAMAHDATGDIVDALVAPADANDAAGDSSDGATREAGASDACASVEDCTNGIDDDCNGAIDCADPACQAGYACVPTTPAGWLGPVALYEGTSAAPGCPTGYAPAVDAHGAPSGGSAQCACSCASAGSQCSASVGQFYSDTNCNNACTGTASVSSGACTAVTHCGGANVSFTAAAPTWTGGTCTAQASTTLPSLTYASTARLCSTAAQDAPGGCTGTGQQCLPLPMAPYGTRACIYLVGDPPPSSCPAGPYSAYHVFYSAAADTRGCTMCQCGGTATGGTCSGEVDVYSGSSCTGTTPSPFVFGTTTCLGLSSPQHTQGNYTASAGTCAAPSGGTATGGVQGTGATTVCCLP